MEIKRGIPVSPGVAIGPALVLDTEWFRIPQRSVEPRQVEETERPGSGHVDVRELVECATRIVDLILSLARIADSLGATHADVRVGCAERRAAQMVRPRS